MRQISRFLIDLACHCRTEDLGKPTDAPAISDGVSSICVVLRNPDDMHSNMSLVASLPISSVCWLMRDIAGVM